ncbi:MAG TPA: glycine oxidase ThiO [bacterium]|nr:glycine oxidase ThiO [bacterium]
MGRRVIIIGGGVIGLSIAEHCLRRGLQPVVVDKGPFAREASWAGAGYLDLRSASGVGGAFFALCKKSYDLFPEWTERLKKESGVDPELLDSGSLDLAFNDEEETAIHRMESNLKTFGLSGQWLSPTQAAQIEPGLSPQLKSIFYLKETRQVRSPRLTRALMAVLQKGKAELRELETVEDFLLKGRQIIGVRTSKGVLEGDAVVVASGAWSGALAEKLELKLEAKPFRGQVVMFRTQPGTLRHILFTGIQKAFTYLVPRKDGHIYVGSTLEDAGFEKTTTPEGMEKLKTGAAKVLPGLSQQLIEDTWAGLRPGSLDGWPYLGRVPGREGLFWATGHFTHGILLSAITGLLMSQALMGERPALDLMPFALDRTPHPAAGI